jgi:hypothetical protein
MDGLTFLLVCMLGAVGVGVVHTMLDGLAARTRTHNP